MKNAVLLHGWGATATKLKPLASELEKRGWEVKNIDVPGFGLPESKMAWGLADYADYVLERIGKRWREEGWIFFGHSFGGRVAIKAAVDAQEGLKGVVICAPGGLEKENYLRLKIFKLAAKVGKAVFGEDPRMKRWLYKLARVHDYENATDIMKETFKRVVEEGLMTELSQIRLPVLILWGKQDRTVSYSGGLLAREKISRSELELFEEEGHRLPYNQPAWVAERINQWFGELS